LKLNKYLIQITKDIVVELESEIEAQQVTEMIADRESCNSFMGLVSTVRSSYRVLSSV